MIVDWLSDDEDPERGFAEWWARFHTGNEGSADDSPFPEDWQDNPPDEDADDVD
ncbi:MAG: hypothetical protein J7551_01300 [Chloroflexi bacterium]|nr:hypothetical protein [Chloroflexota bacterium]